MAFKKVMHELFYRNLWSFDTYEIMIFILHSVMNKIVNKAALTTTI